MSPPDGETYLNNATVSYPKSQVALNAMWEAATAPPRDIRHSSLAEASLPAARKIASGLLGCKPANLYFLPDATTGINAVLRGYLDSGDICVTDNRPHNAIVRTLSALKGVRWRIHPLYAQDETFLAPRIDTEFAAGARLVCLTHGSNVTGAIYPIEEVIAEIKRSAPDCAVLVDAAQSAGVAPLDKLEQADFVVVSGHKYLHSLSGSAVLLVRRKLRPLLFGGTGSNSEDLQPTSGDEFFLDVGTPNLPAINALVSALNDWGENQAKFASQLGRARNEALEVLARAKHLEVLEPKSLLTTGSIACRPLRGHSEQDWAPFLRANGVIVRGGLHCSPTHHTQLGLMHCGTLRISVSRYTSASDIDHLDSALRDFENMLSRGGPSAIHSEPPLRSFQQLTAVLHQVRPCAEQTGVVEICGEIVSGDLTDFADRFQSAGWRVLNPNGAVPVVRKDRVMLMLGPSSQFTMARVGSSAEAIKLLDELAIGVLQDAS